MPRDIELGQLRSLLDSGGVQLIEVLPEKEYAEEHLVDAINISLKSMDRDSVRGLDPTAPTVVYCWDDI